MKRAGKWWVPDAEELQMDALGRGGWQIDHLETALQHVRSFRCAVDGGAHIGSWTVAMAEQFEHVVAFEPAEDTFRCLEKNVDRWRSAHPHRHIDLSRFALGETIEAGFGMEEDGRYHGGNTGGRYLVAGQGAISTIPLDRYPLPRALDFLKLDLEGFELFALRGARETIERFKPVILLEDKPRMAHRFGLAPHSARTYAEEELGMRVIDHVGADWILGW